MNIEGIFQDKTLKSKAKVAAIGELLISKKLLTKELIAYTAKQKATDKATCIEAVEYATKKIPSIADEELLAFATKSLKDEEPRVKWESAKVIANTAKHFPDQMEKSLKDLLINAEHSGTVVRWAAASALAEIVQLKMSFNKKLLSKIEALAETEADNAVRKKYLDALKKIKK